MALKHNFQEALVQLNDDLEDYSGDKRKLVRILGLELFRRLVGRSPVDSGFYRSSHDLTLDAESTFVQSRAGLSEGGEREAATQANKAGRQLDRIKGDDVTRDIFLSNNAPYAGRLENGHSKQAPQGIYAVVADEFDSIAARAIRTIF